MSYKRRLIEDVTQLQKELSQLEQTEIRLGVSNEKLRTKISSIENMTIGDIFGAITHLQDDLNKVIELISNRTDIFDDEKFNTIDYFLEQESEDPRYRQHYPKDYK